MLGADGLATLKGAVDRHRCAIHSGCSTSGMTCLAKRYCSLHARRGLMSRQLSVASVVRGQTACQSILCQMLATHAV